jgi:Domain of unknown function (DUF4760)
MAAAARKKRPVGQFAEIKFPVGISLILGLLVCVAGLLFWCYPRLRDELTFLGVAFAMAAGVVAAYYIGRTLQVTVSQRDELIESERVDKAFSFIQRWNGAPFSARQKWRALFQKVKGQSPTEVVTMVQSGPDRAILVDVFNFFEEMSLAINEELADEETLIKFFRDMAESYFAHFEEWIKKSRTDSNHPRPRVYVQFEAVVIRWQQRN